MSAPTDPEVIPQNPAPEISDAVYPVPAEILDYEHTHGMDEEPPA